MTAQSLASDPPDRQSVEAMPHPARFLVLIMPFGINSGFVSLPITYLLKLQGLSLESLSIVVALSYIPQWLKFLWGPLVDTTSTRKRWYIASTLVTAACTFLMGVFCDSRPISVVGLSAAIILSSFTSTLVGMSLESLMAGVVPDSQRGRVGGWYQAGNLGANGVCSGVGYWLVSSGHWSATATTGLLSAWAAACCIALWRIPDPPSPERVRESVAAHARDIFEDLWSTASSRIGALAILICFLPIGSSAAANLWGAISDDWHASAETVAVVAGWMSGLLAAFGCFVGGWLCDRMDRKAAYLLFGLLQVLCAVATAFSPRTADQFVLWVSLYSITQGLAYAAFTAVVLEAIGRTSAATKFSLLASLSNFPIFYMTGVLGIAGEHWGSRGIYLCEAAIATGAMLLFMIVAKVTREKRPAPIRGGDLSS